MKKNRSVNCRFVSPSSISRHTGKITTTHFSPLKTTHKASLWTVFRFDLLSEFLLLQWRSVIVFTLRLHVTWFWLFLVDCGGQSVAEQGPSIQSLLLNQVTLGLPGGRFLPGWGECFEEQRLYGRGPPHWPIGRHKLYRPYLRSWRNGGGFPHDFLIGNTLEVWQSEDLATVPVIKAVNSVAKWLSGGPCFAPV